MLPGLLNNTKTACNLAPRRNDKTQKKIVKLGSGMEATGTGIAG